MFTVRGYMPLPSSAEVGQFNVEMSSSQHNKVNGTYKGDFYIEEGPVYVRPEKFMLYW